MQKNLEIEFKTILNKEQFNKLLSHYNNYEVIDQTNYYFDTPSFELRSKKITVRIRNIQDTYLFTLKETKPEGVLEQSLPVKSQNVTELNHPDIQKLLSQYINPTDIQSLGSLRTIRHSILDDDKEICIDHNFYHGLEDYEIEYELKKINTNAFQEFKEILDLHNIVYQPAKPKFIRFIQAITKENLNTI